MEKHVLEHFQKNDPSLYEVALKVEHLIKTQISEEENFLHDLCDHIISQQLAGAASETIFNRFKALFKNKKITPQKILDLPDEKLRSVGLSGAKTKYIKDLAKKVFEGELVLEELPKLTNEQVIAELTKVKGIGKWTAEMFLMFNLGREDVFSYGDLGLMNAIIRLYKIEGKPTKDQLEKLEENWKPYRSFASRILWKSLTLPSSS
jgi:DNA-3-methyladenine glycosylase II